MAVIGSDKALLVLESGLMNELRSEQKVVVSGKMEMRLICDRGFWLDARTQVGIKTSTQVIEGLGFEHAIKQIEMAAEPTRLLDVSFSVWQRADYLQNDSRSR